MFQLPANTAPVVKTEDCEDMEERPSVTPEPAVKTPEELLNHRFEVPVTLLECFHLIQLSTF